MLPRRGPYLQHHRRQVKLVALAHAGQQLMHDILHLLREVIQLVGDARVRRGA